MKIYKAKQQYQNSFRFSNKKIIVSAFLLLIILPVTLMVVSSIRASHTSSNLREIEDEISFIKNENRKVESEIISQSSLFDVSQNIEDFGLIKAEKVVYIQKDQNIAQLR